jgi:hypothetical protein
LFVWLLPWGNRKKNIANIDYISEAGPSLLKGGVGGRRGRRGKRD